MDENINLPNLLIVGAAKSGTTSLHNYLKQHPAIFMTEHKEPHFLIRPNMLSHNLCSGTTSILETKSTKKELVKIIDILGRETNRQHSNTPLFYIYDDGSVEKKIIIE